MSVVLAQKRETAPGDVTSDVGSRWQNREIGVDRKYRSTRVVTFRWWLSTKFRKEIRDPSRFRAVLSKESFLETRTILRNERAFLGNKSLLQKETGSIDR
jgi:hypothetical protein